MLQLQILLTSHIRNGCFMYSDAAYKFTCLDSDNRKIMKYYSSGIDLGTWARDVCALYTVLRVCDEILVLTLNNYTLNMIYFFVRNSKLLEFMYEYRYVFKENEGFNVYNLLKGTTHGLYIFRLLNLLESLFSVVLFKNVLVNARNYSSIWVWIKGLNKIVTLVDIFLIPLFYAKKMQFSNDTYFFVSVELI